MDPTPTYCWLEIDLVQATVIGVMLFHLFVLVGTLSLKLGSLDYTVVNCSKELYLSIDVHPLIHP